MTTSLTNFRLLGKSGLRVSPLTLGTMTFGTEWGWGTEKEESLRILNQYLEKGGNSIDTANVYTGGTSESFLGEFLQGRRERVVLATKYTSCMDPTDPNACGNHRKNMMQSVHASLRRLKTDYIDLYWVHAWEHRTPIEEVMRGLDDLVRQGKILYIGISDTPAWKIAQANKHAHIRGLTSFIAMQIHYNLIERSVEPELVSMARELNIAVMPWSPLAGGVLSGKYTRDDIKSDPASLKGTRKEWILKMQQLTDRTLTIVDTIKNISAEIDRTPSQVALNWLMHKPGVTSIIIGARRFDQLNDNLGALDFTLSDDHMKWLDDVSAYPLPFPYNFLTSDRIRQVMEGSQNIEGGIHTRF